MIEKYDIRDIRDRAQGVSPGGVLPDEVEYARRMLRERREPITAGLYVIGYCGNPDDAELLEQFLLGEENDAYADVALICLCRHLGLVNRYRGLIGQLIISGASDDIRRSAAIQLCKEYFIECRDDVLGCRLVEILCDSLDADQSIARAALVEILKLHGRLISPYIIKGVLWDEDDKLILEESIKYFNCGTAKLQHVMRLS
ncbi:MULTISPECIES: hypothetical protein [unclassified Chelatococcus]|uniref:hypothetical protein n=1 Tax=unclassified Chelatococcus TaxID=2638111 RepID=UPI0012E16655|nr:MULTISPECIES: hypothetical protein [unclassified Chelatococcus]